MSMAPTKRAQPAPSVGPAPAPPPALLTTQEAAALLRVHPKQVYRLFARGLPHRRVGSEWRYERDELLAWAGGAPRPTKPSSTPPPIVASNGDVVVGLLLRAASRPEDLVLGSALADRHSGFQLLRKRAVLASGFHGTSFPAEAPEGRVARLHLVRRAVGLIGPRGSAPRLADVPRARLALRPSTAGIRAVLDDALRAAGIAWTSARRRVTEHVCHLDAASAVLRGEADLGLATEAWAHALGLAFLPLAEEDYGLLLFAAHLGEPAAVRLCEAAQSKAFRQALALPGYDARECGRIHLDPTRPA